MIAAIDPGTKLIGYAGPELLVCTIRTHAGADDRGRRLFELDSGLVFELRRNLPELVVIEAPSLGSPGTLGKIRQAEARGVILLRLYLEAVPFVEVTPGALKRFATGHGTADKRRMQAAALTMTNGDRTFSEDEADAFHLRRLGRCAYGLEPTLHDHELEVVASIDWPALPSLTRRVQPGALS